MFRAERPAEQSPAQTEEFTEGLARWIPPCDPADKQYPGAGFDHGGICGKPLGGDGAGSPKRDANQTYCAQHCCVPTIFNELFVKVLVENI